MPMYDRICTNGHKLIDCWEPVTAPVVACPECGKETERAWLTKPSNVIGDDIPGGIWIRHGLCNEDGSPRKYYSHSEMRAEAKRRDLVNAVRHTTGPDSDKSKHTVIWTSIPANEEERLAAWHAHEATLNLNK